MLRSALLLPAGLSLVCPEVPLRPTAACLVTVWPPPSGQFSFSVISARTQLPTRRLSQTKNRARGGTRTRKPFGIRPSNVRVYQFHHPSIQESETFRRREQLASVVSVLAAE